MDLVLVGPLGQPHPSQAENTPSNLVVIKERMKKHADEGFAFFCFRIFAQMCGKLGARSLRGSVFMTEAQFQRFKPGLEAWGTRNAGGGELRDRGPAVPWAFRSGISLDTGHSGAPAAGPRPHPPSNMATGTHACARRSRVHARRPTIVGPSRFQRVDLASRIFEENRARCRRGGGCRRRGLRRGRCRFGRHWWRRRSRMSCVAALPGWPEVAWLAAWARRCHSSLGAAPCRRSTGLASRQGARWMAQRPDVFGVLGLPRPPPSLPWVEGRGRGRCSTGAFSRECVEGSVTESVGRIRSGP